MNLPESGFAIFWMLFISGYSVWIDQRVDLLYFGYCLHLYIVRGLTREWIYCILEIVNIFEQTAYCANSEYLYTNILKLPHPPFPVQIVRALVLWLICGFRSGGWMLWPGVVMGCLPCLWRCLSVGAYLCVACLAFRLMVWRSLG